MKSYPTATHSEVQTPMQSSIHKPQDLRTRICGQASIKVLNLENLGRQPWPPNQWIWCLHGNVKHGHSGHNTHHTTYLKWTNINKSYLGSTWCRNYRAKLPLGKKATGPRDQNPYRFEGDFEYRCMWAAIHYKLDIHAPFQLSYASRPHAYMSSCTAVTRCSVARGFTPHFRAFEAWTRVPRRPTKKRLVLAHVHLDRILQLNIPSYWYQVIVDWNNSWNIRRLRNTNTGDVVQDRTNVSNFSPFWSFCLLLTSSGLHPFLKQRKSN